MWYIVHAHLLSRVVGKALKILNLRSPKICVAAGKLPCHETSEFLFLYASRPASFRAFAFKMILKSINKILDDKMLIERTESGIYFLILENKIVYVGQSSNITARINTHKINDLKRFDSYSIIEYPPDEDLDDIEASYILALKPIYNTSVPKNKTWCTIANIKKETGLRLDKIKKYIKLKNIEEDTKGYFRRSDFADMLTRLNKENTNDGG